MWVALYNGAGCRLILAGLRPIPSGGGRIGRVGRCLPARSVRAGPTWGRQRAESRSGLGRHALPPRRGRHAHPRRSVPIPRTRSPPIRAACQRRRDRAGRTSPGIPARPAPTSWTADQPLAPAQSQLSHPLSPVPTSSGCPIRPLGDGGDAAMPHACWLCWTTPHRSSRSAHRCPVPLSCVVVNQP